MIEFLIGAALVLGLTWTDHRWRRRAGAVGADELLPWAELVREDLIAMKSAAFLRVWQLDGPDFETSDDVALEERMERIAEILDGIGGGATLHFDLVRIPCEGYPATAPGAPSIAAELDEIRRRRYSEGRYETRLLLSVCVEMEAAQVQGLRDFFMTGPSDRRSGFEDSALRCEDRLIDFEERLGAVVGLRRLAGSELVSYLGFCVSGEWSDGGGGEVGAPLELSLAHEIVTGHEPSVDGRRVKSYGVRGFPGRTWVGMLRSILEQDTPCRFSVRWVSLSESEGRAALRARLKSWVRRRNDPWRMLTRTKSAKTQAREKEDEAFEDGDALRNIAELGALEDLKTSWGHVSPVLTVYGSEEDGPEEYSPEEEGREIVKRLTALRFRIAQERANAVEAWRSTWPGDRKCNVRRALCSSRHLTRIAPLTSAWHGRRRAGAGTLLACSRAGGRSRFSLDIFSGGVGHLLTIGRTGGGKSVLLVSLGAAFLARNPGGRVVVLDYGASSRIAAEAMGRYSLIRPGGSLRLAPLAGTDDPAERDWIAGWLKDVLEGYGLETSSGRMNAVREALSAVGELPRAERLFAALIEQMREKSVRDALRSVRESAAGLLDGREELAPEGLGTWESFELRDLIGGVSEALAAPLTWLLIHQLESRFREGVPTLLLIDEAARILADERIAKRIDAWLVTLRKDRTAVGLFTQTPEQLARSSAFATLVQSIPTQILLPDAKAVTNAAMYESLGLAAGEIRHLAGLRERTYYVRTESGHATIDLELSPGELSIFGTTEGRSLKEAHARMEGLQREDAEGWALRMIEEG